MGNIRSMGTLESQKFEGGPCFLENLCPPLRIVLQFKYIPRTIHLQSRIWMYLKFFENKRRTIQIWSKSEMLLNCIFDFQKSLWMYFKYHPEWMVFEISRKTKIATFDNSNAIHVLSMPRLVRKSNSKIKTNHFKIFQSRGRMSCKTEKLL